MSHSSTSEVRVSTAHMFELLLDGFPDIIQSVDADGTIVYANRRAAHLLGYAPAELLGKNVTEIYAPEVLDKVRHGFAKLKTSGNLTVNESLLVDRAGNRIPVEIRSFAVYDEAGQFLRTFSILRDIRDIKELQNSLIHAGRLAAIGELAACVAHDINNPLSVIKLYLDMLKHELRDIAGIPASASDLFADGIASIAKASERIERLANHLREFSRTRENQSELVNLHQTLSDALFMVTGKINENNLTVVKELPDAAPYVLGDASQLEQVFMNLLSNACDATKGHPAPELHISIAAVTGGARHNHWAIKIRDNGAGIPPGVHDQIFTPFFTTKPKGQGTGLGLSISRHIVRRHRGEIHAASEPGQGATFTVFLPIADLAAMAQPQPPADTAAPAAS